MLNDVRLTEPGDGDRFLHQPGDVFYDADGDVLMYDEDQQYVRLTDGTRWRRNQIEKPYRYIGRGATITIEVGGGE